MAQGIFFPQQGEATSLVIKIELSSKMFGPRQTDTGISINIYANRTLPYEYREHDLSVNTRFQLHTNVLRFEHLV